MELSAVDKARNRWGIDKQAPIVIDGSGDGQEYEDARKIVRGLMPQLVGLDGVVRKTTLAELDSLMTSFGLEKVDEKDSPEGQLFYQRGRLLVRIKPKGNPPGSKYRVGQPHLSVCLMKDAVDTEFTAELVKFSPTGKARPKSLNPIPGGALFLPVIGTPKKRRFDGNANEWASTTHFDFPPGITEVT